MSIYNIPVDSSGGQRFSIILNSISYDLLVSFNQRVGYWTVDIESNGLPVVSGLVLVGGVDLVKQYVFELRSLWTINITDSQDDASSDNLGTAVLFLHVDEVSLAEARSAVGDEAAAKVLFGE